MRIHIAYIQGAYLRDYEKAYASLVCDELQTHGEAAGLTVEQDPTRADAIVFLQSAQYKTPEYIRLLEEDPLVRNQAERVSVIDYDDHPTAMLAGLYTSIEHPFFDPEIHKSWPILFMNNALVYGLANDEVLASKPRRLFSFVGAASHPIRRRLFMLFSDPSAEHHVEELKKWYNHNDDDRRRFLEITLDCVFCLCPRGYACYTNRISEVMAMARVPVIIADDWIPFSFDENFPYYIQVPEKDIAHLPEILSQHRDKADEYRRNARMLWEKYCSKKRRVVSAIEGIAKLSARPGGRRSYADYREHWHSKEFLQKTGWTPRQQFALRVEQHVRRWFPAVKIPGVSALTRYRNAPNMK